MTNAQSAALAAVALASLMVAVAVGDGGGGAISMVALAGLAVFGAGLGWGRTGLIVVGLMTAAAASASATGAASEISDTLLPVGLGLAAVASLHLADASDWLRRDAVVERRVWSGISGFVVFGSMAGAVLTAVVGAILGDGPRTAWFVPAAIAAAALTSLAAIEASRRRHRRHRGLQQ